MAKELEKIFVKPGPGMMVRDEFTKILLANEGEWKPKSTYWLRRLRFGDVVEATPPTVKKTSTRKSEDAE